MGEKMKKITVLTFVLAAFLVVSCGSGSDSGKSGNSDAESNTSKCGNGKIDEGEVCDGNVPCWQAGHFYPELEAVCNSDCTAYDTSKCMERDPNDNCGNFQIDSGESCEQGNTKPCAELSSSFTQGDAQCRRDCRGWNVENCSNGGKTKPCSLILDCVKKCGGDASCESSCKEEGTEQGAALYSELENCVAACGGITNEECLTKTCYDAYYACNPNQKCGNGNLDEGEICEAKETKACQELNTDDKQWQPINEAVCNSSCTGWDTYSCVDINALTCYQVYECVEECKDSACEDACIKKTWPAAKAKYDTMMECLTVNECVVAEECMSGVCKFQADACKTHLTCGNSNIDNYEICEKGEHIDCGDIKNSNGEAMYEAGTGSAYCNQNCTEYGTTMCYRFCSCSEVKTCIEQECGGYPNSNAENTDEKKACMEECESWGSKIGKGEAAGYRQLIESCCEQDQQGNTTACGWDSSTCLQQAPSQAGATCGTEDNQKCPY